MERDYVCWIRTGREGSRPDCADLPLFLRRQGELSEVSHLVEASIVYMLARDESHVLENAGVIQLVMSCWLVLLGSIGRLCPNLGIEGQNNCIKVWQNENIIMGA